MDNIVSEETKIFEEREGTVDEARSALSLIVSLVARGYQPEHVMGILTDAICQSLVLFSPSLPQAIENFEGCVPNVKDCVTKNFENQEHLQKIFTEKIERIAPLAAAMGLYKHMERG